MANKYPHMCRDGHIEIGHADSEDEETCPVCRLLYALDFINDHAPELVDRAIARFKIQERVVR